MKRTAHVLQAARVNVPDSNEDVLQIITDYFVPDSRAFYVPRDTPPPADGDEVTWFDHHAVIGAVQVPKIGYSFDPDRPLR